MSRHPRTFGPSNDVPKEVRIEIRAAEIAAVGVRGIKLWGEHDGWYSVSRNPPGGTRPFRNRPPQQSGYLARVIHAHKS